MMGFPLQLPIDAMAARAVELTDWQGDIAGAGDHRGKALVIAVKSEAEAKALAAWISGIPVAVTVQKEQEKLHAAPFAVAGITPEMIADLIASLRDGDFELPAAMRDKSWAKKSADQIMAVAANVIKQLEAAITRADLAAVPAQAPEGAAHIVEYTNWRGETAIRTIRPISMWWGKTDWHPEEQWMLTAYDCEKGAVRDFAWQDMRPVPNPATSAVPAQPQPDPRDEVIARLVEALRREKSLAWIIENSTQESVRDVARFVMDEQTAALAAAKAVKHG
jgi:predicted DNA-binding transcriptional regulator YafY